MRMHPRLLFRVQHVMFRHLEKLLLRLQRGTVFARLSMRQTRLLEQLSDFFRRLFCPLDVKFLDKIGIFLRNADTDRNKVIFFFCHPLPQPFTHSTCIHMGKPPIGTHTATMETFCHFRQLPRFHAAHHDIGRFAMYVH